MNATQIRFAASAALAAAMISAPALAAEKAPKDKGPKIERRVETLQIGPNGEIACSGDEALCDAIRKGVAEGHGATFERHAAGPGERDVRRIIMRADHAGLGPRAFAFAGEPRGPRSVTECTRSEAKETAPGEKSYTLSCTERQIGENEVVFLDRGGPGFTWAPPVAPPTPPAPPRP